MTTRSRPPKQKQNRPARTVRRVKAWGGFVDGGLDPRGESQAFGTAIGSNDLNRSRNWTTEFPWAFAIYAIRKHAEQCYEDIRPVTILIPALIVVVVGGLGSLKGSLIGSLIIGQAETFGKAWLPEAAMLIIYVVMAGIVLIRPQGLFGRPLK